jgi:hypothetical protein
VGDRCCSGGDGSPMIGARDDGLERQRSGLGGSLDGDWGLRGRSRRDRRRIQRRCCGLWPGPGLMVCLHGSVMHRLFWDRIRNLKSHRDLVVKKLRVKRGDLLEEIPRGHKF